MLVEESKYDEPDSMKKGTKKSLNGFQREDDLMTIKKTIPKSITVWRLIAKPNMMPYLKLRHDLPQPKQIHNPMFDICHHHHG